MVWGESRRGGRKTGTLIFGYTPNRGLGKAAEHVYLGKGLGVGKVGGEADLGVPSPTICLPTGPLTGVPCFVSRKKDGMGWLKM